MNTGFAYPSEKFSAARSNLMLPHLRGEADSISMAFSECSLGLAGVDKNTLDDEARRWVAELDDLMDTTGFEDPDGKKGLWMVQAETFTNDEMFQISNLVDTLAFWFREQLRSS